MPDDKTKSGVPTEAVYHRGVCTGLVEEIWGDGGKAERSGAKVGPSAEAVKKYLGK